MTRTRMGTIAALAGAAIGLVDTSVARADDRYWYWAGSTTFENYFNGAFAGPPYWYGSSVPGAGDTIHFSQGLVAPGCPEPSFDNPYGSVPSVVYFGRFNHHSFNGDVYTSYDAVSATVDRAFVHNGLFEFNFGSGKGGWNPSMPGPSQGELRITHSTYVGDLDAQIAELRIREGTLKSNGVAHLALGIGSTGIVDVSGPTARWEVGAWMDLGWVGSGTLRVQDGAQVTVGNNVYAGIRDGSEGTVLVTNGGKLTTLGRLELGSGGESAHGWVHGSLSVSGTGSEVAFSELFVGNRGPGSADIRNRATLTASDIIRVASPGTASSLSVSGGASVNARRLAIGTLGLTMDNLVEVGGPSTSLLIGDEIVVGNEKSGGQLALTEGSTCSAARAYVAVGSGAYGDISVDRNAHLNISGPLSLGFGGVGHLLVKNGGDVLAGDLAVGDDGNGSFGSISAQGAGTLVRSGYTLTIGAGGAQGTVAASNGASIQVANAINVGLTSSGSLSLSGGSSAQSEFGRIARYAGSSGLATVSGSGSRWDVGSSMFVGGHSSTGQGGTGSLEVSSGGTVTAGQALGTWRQGTVDVTNGGRIQIGAGEVSTVPSGAVRVGPGGTLFGDGTILGDVILSGGTISPGHSPGIMTIEGDLSLDSQGALFMEVGGASRDRYDGIILANTQGIELGGVLMLSFIDGFSPRQGDVFDLLLVPVDAQITGHFSAIDIQNLAPGWDYRMAFDPTTRTLQVVSLNDGVFVPGPGVVSLLAIFGLAKGTRRRSMTALGI